MLETSTFKSKLRNFFSATLWIRFIRSHAPNISAEAAGWSAVVLLHLATIPTLLAVLTGLTERLPPVDLILFSWIGLFLLFLKATVQKDLLNIVTIGFGFFVQACLLALIVFK